MNENNYCIIHGVSGSYSTLPLWFRRYWYLFSIQSCGFLHKIIFAEEIIKSGVAKVGSPKFFFGATFSILLITADLEMVETKVNFEKKFEIQSSLKVTNFFNSYICFIPLRPPQKHPHFDGFFYLFGKLKTSLGNFFR